MEEHLLLPREGNRGGANGLPWPRRHLRGALRDADHQRIGDEERDRGRHPQTSEKRRHAHDGRRRHFESSTWRDDYRGSTPCGDGITLHIFLDFVDET